MPLYIKDSVFENSRTAIKATGQVDLTLEGVEFRQNDKDIDLHVDETSQIVVQNILSIDCKTESITYQEYSSIIKESLTLLQKNQDQYTGEQLEQIRTIIREIGKSKDSPSKIQWCLRQILDIGKSTVSAMIVAYLKMRYGWH